MTSVEIERLRAEHLKQKKEQEARDEASKRVAVTEGAQDINGPTIAKAAWEERGSVDGDQGQPPVDQPQPPPVELQPHTVDAWSGKTSQELLQEGIHGVPEAETLDQQPTLGIIPIDPDMVGGREDVKYDMETGGFFYEEVQLDRQSLTAYTEPEQHTVRVPVEVGTSVENAEWRQKIAGATNIQLERDLGPLTTQMLQWPVSPNKMSQEDFYKKTDGSSLDALEYNTPARRKTRTKAASVAMKVSRAAFERDLRNNTDLSPEMQDKVLASDGAQKTVLDLYDNTIADALTQGTSDRLKIGIDMRNTLVGAIHSTNTDILAVGAMLGLPLEDKVNRRTAEFNKWSAQTQRSSHGWGTDLLIDTYGIGVPMAVSLATGSVAADASGKMFQGLIWAGRALGGVKGTAAIKQANSFVKAMRSLKMTSDKVMPMSYWFAQGAGEIERRLNPKYNDGVGVGNALTRYAASWVGGALYAGIENLQVKTIVAGRIPKGVWKEASNRAALRLGERLAQGGGRYFSAILSEAGEEGFQSLNQDGWELLAKELHNALSAEEFQLDTKDIDAILKDGWEEFKAAIGPMAVLSLKGGAVNLKEELFYTQNLRHLADTYKLDKSLPEAQLKELVGDILQRQAEEDADFKVEFAAIGDDQAQPDILPDAETPSLQGEQQAEPDPIYGADGEPIDMAAGLPKTPQGVTPDRKATALERVLNKNAKVINEAKKIAKDVVVLDGDNQMRAKAKLLGAEGDLSTDEIDGFVADGVVYINAEAGGVGRAGARSFTETVTHEVVGHLAMDAFGGSGKKRAQSLVSSLLKSKNKTAVQIAADLEANYDLEVGSAEWTQEFIAAFAEHDTSTLDKTAKGALKKLMQWLKAGLSRAGLSQKFGEDELRQLLVKATRRAKKTGVAKSGTKDVQMANVRKRPATANEKAVEKALGDSGLAVSKEFSGGGLGTAYYYINHKGYTLKLRVGTHDPNPERAVVGHEKRRTWELSVHPDGLAIKEAVKVIKNPEMIVDHFKGRVSTIAKARARRAALTPEQRKAEDAKRLAKRKAGQRYVQAQKDTRKAAAERKLKAREDRGAAHTKRVADLAKRLTPEDIAMVKADPSDFRVAREVGNAYGQPAKIVKQAVAFLDKKTDTTEQVKGVVKDAQATSQTGRQETEGEKRHARLVDGFNHKESDEGAWHDEGRGRGSYSLGVIGHDVEVVRTYKPSPKMIEKDSSFSELPTMIELAPTKQSARLFSKAITASKRAHTYGASVAVYSVKEYAEMRLFLAPNGTFGFAVKPDGDMVSGFALPTAPPNSMVRALPLAIQVGGRKCDCFDTVLPSLYAFLGLETVARIKWNNDHAPKDWNKKTFEKFNNGEPDVVFAAYRGGDPATLVERLGSLPAYEAGQGEVFDDYDAAVDKQTQSIQFAKTKTSDQRALTTKDRGAPIDAARKEGLKEGKDLDIRVTSSSIKHKASRKDVVRYLFDKNQIRAIAEEVKASGKPVAVFLIEAGYRLPKSLSKLEVVGEFLEQLELAVGNKRLPATNTPPDVKKKVARAVKVLLPAAEYQLAHTKGGAEWYGESIVKTEERLRKIFPSLKDPARMDLFKLLAAITSYGSDVETNFKNATRIWKWFEKYNNFHTPLNYTSATLSGWSGQPSAGQDKLALLEHLLNNFDRDIPALMEWINSRHTGREIIEMAASGGSVKSVSGRTNNEKDILGSTIIGPKGGVFYANLRGESGELTADFWFSRTWYRAMGSLMTEIDPRTRRKGRSAGIDRVLVDSPKTESDRVSMGAAIAQVAKDLTKATDVETNVAAVQAMLWYFEQDLYYALSGNDAFLSTSFDVAAKAADKMLQGVDPTKHFGPMVPTAVNVEVASGGGSIFATTLIGGAESETTLATAFDSLDHVAKEDVTREVVSRLAGLVAAKAGVNITEQGLQMGFWGDAATPSGTLHLDTTVASDADVFAATLGAVLQQEGMAVSNRLIGDAAKGHRDGTELGISIDNESERSQEATIALYHAVRGAINGMKNKLTVVGATSTNEGLAILFEGAVKRRRTVTAEDGTKTTQSVDIVHLSEEKQQHEVEKVLAGLDVEGVGGLGVSFTPVKASFPWNDWGSQPVTHEQLTIPVGYIKFILDAAERGFQQHKQELIDEYEKDLKEHGKVRRKKPDPKKKNYKGFTRGIRAAKWLRNDWHRIQAIVLSFYGTALKRHGGEAVATVADELGASDPVAFINAHERKLGLTLKGGEGKVDAAARAEDSIANAKKPKTDSEKEVIRKETLPRLGNVAKQFPKKYPDLQFRKSRKKKIEAEAKKIDAQAIIAVFHADEVNEKSEAQVFADTMIAKAEHLLAEKHTPQEIMEQFFFWRDSNANRAKAKARKIQMRLKQITKSSEYKDNLKKAGLPVFTAQELDTTVMLIVDLGLLNDVDKAFAESDFFYKYITKRQQAMVRLATLVVSTEQDTPMGRILELADIAAEIDVFNQAWGEVAESLGVIDIAVENYIMRRWGFESIGAKGVKGYGTAGKFMLGTASSKHRKLTSILEGWAKIPAIPTNEEFEEAEAVGIELWNDDWNTQYPDGKEAYTLLMSGASHSMMQAVTEITAVSASRMMWGRLESMGFVSRGRPDADTMARWTNEANAAVGSEFMTAEVMVRTDRKAKPKNKAYNQKYLSVKPSRQFSGVGGKGGGKGLPSEFFAHPLISKQLRSTLEESGVRRYKFGTSVLRINSLIKSAVLWWSFFHHQAFLRSFYYGAAFDAKSANPYAAVKAGRDAYMEFSGDVELLVGAGLTIDESLDWKDARPHLDPNGTFNKLVTKFKVTDVIATKIGEWHERQSQFLFGVLGNGLKMQAALLEFTHLKRKFAAKVVSGKMTERDIAGMVARLINADFGGLHHERMGRSKTAMDTLRLLFLAPDWTESNFQTLVRAFKRGEEGGIYRRFWGRSLSRSLALTQLLNLAIAGYDDEETYWSSLMKAFGYNDFSMTSALWKEGQYAAAVLEFFSEFEKSDLRKLRWLDVDITPLVKGIAKDRLSGTEMEDLKSYRYSFNVMGHLKDPLKWGLRPVASIKHKGSPLLGVLMAIMTGSDWRGQTYLTSRESSSKTLPKKNKWGHTNEINKHYHKLTKWGMGSHPSITGPMIAAELFGFTPIVAQSFADYTTGELDSFLAASRGLGFMTSRMAQKYPVGSRDAKGKDISGKPVKRKGVKYYREQAERVRKILSQ